MDLEEIVLQLVLVAAAVLLFSGAAKVAEPASARQLLRSLRLPASPVLVRAIGVLEVLAGTAAIMFGGLIAGVVVAGAYLSFAAVVAVALRSGVESCGCFGERSAPPSVGHLVLNLTFATLGAGAVVLGVPSTVDAVDTTTLLTLCWAALLMVGGWLVSVLYTQEARP